MVETATTAKAPVEKSHADKAEAQDKAAKARVARPDASAMPEGSSAPTLPQRPAEARAGEDGEEGAAPRRAPRAEAPATPQVRIISRPVPGATPSQDARPARTGDSRPGGYPPRDGAGRPPRPGGPRPGGPGGPGGALLAAPAPAAPQAALGSRQRLLPLPTPVMDRARKSVSRVAVLLIFSRVILVAAVMMTTVVA